jgi:hypothetical protein
MKTPKKDEFEEMVHFCKYTAKAVNNEFKKTTQKLPLVRDVTPAPIPIKSSGESAVRLNGTRYTETQVREMRNKVIGCHTSDTDWERCKDYWMRGASIYWLESQIKDIETFLVHKD